MTIQLTKDPVDYASLVESSRDAAAGAVVLFLGTVREMSEGRSVASLEYEAFPAMAEKKLAELADDARQRWPLTQASVVHRGPATSQRR